ncbi:MAG: pyrimidine dimer DNA glycosylase/endonuclease V [Candidatus Aenigmarchaeota archaeon]|nr:pyrimidine dimer DNA glycosylase/endonuclease V [Candidatus Aenigmarchaeota archaeon]
MVRVNIINPENLADQHLIAEYNEILMLISYAKRYPDTKGIPEKFCLGKGHMKFFKDKMKYIKSRHEKIKKEMEDRGFIPKKTINLSGIKNNLINDWKPDEADKSVIRKRLIEKIKLKPEYYRYYGKSKSLKFLINLIKNG